MLLLKNAQILLPNYTISCGEVLVNNDGIIEQVHTDPMDIITTSRAELLPETEVVDLHQNLLTPGFVNAHAHSAMTVFSGAADDLPLQEWLTEQIFPREANMTDEQVYWLTKLAILEYLSGGITTAFDMYFHQHAVAKAAQDMGFRMVLCGSINDFGGSVTDLERKFNQYGNNPNALISFRFGIHAQYTTSLEVIRQVSEVVNRLQQPFFTHCSETKREVDQCYREYAKSPIELFQDEHLFKYGGGIFHGVHVDLADQEILKHNNIGIISCPSSNLKLASGICPLKRFDDAKLSIGLGTDGPASNNALSMLREMYLATALQKCTTNNPTALPPERVYHFATLGGAELISVNSGIIAEGYLADFAVVNLNTPTTLLNNPLKNIVYSADRKDIIMTIVNGRILYQNNSFVNIDVNEIYSKCHEISAQILGV